MNEQVLAKTAQLLDQSLGAFAAFAVLDENGYPHASVVTITSAKGMDEIMFSSDLDSNKARRIAKSGKSSINYFTSNFNITLVGTTEILTDLETKTKNWRQGWEDMWPEGSSSPNFCVFRFKTERYSLYVDDMSAAGTL